MKTTNIRLSKGAGKKVLQFFSSLADETRLHILLSLAGGPRNVNDIYNFVGRTKVTLSAISHQLRQLSDMGIVSYKKKGKEKFFELSDNYCWCILKNALNQFGSNVKIKCKRCAKRGRGNE